MPAADLVARDKPAFVPDGAASIELPYPVVTDRGAAQSKQKRRRQYLLEIKTLFAGGNEYLNGTRAREDQSGAVAARASHVWGDYLAKGRAADARYSPAGTTPILDRIRGFTRARALVFGNYSEASPDVHHCIAAAAAEAAKRNWRELGARRAEEAKSFYVASFRRRLGVFVAREFARHRLSRECFIGVPRRLVDLRVLRQGMGYRRPDAGDGPTPADFFAHQQRIIHPA